MFPAMRDVPSFPGNCKCGRECHNRSVMLLSSTLFRRVTDVKILVQNVRSHDRQTASAMTDYGASAARQGPASTLPVGKGGKWWKPDA